MRKELSDAIDSGQVLLIKYFGGSKPGASRQISPMSFVGDDKVRAYCYVSNQPKLFVIEKIEILDSDQETTGNYETTPAPIGFQTLSEALDHQIDHLKSLGWHVKTDPKRYSIHGYFKNGKPRATEIASIKFQEFTSVPIEFSVEITFDFSDADEIDDLKPEGIDSEVPDDSDFFGGYEKRKATRPWVVRCKDESTLTYKSLDKATAKFMEWAKKQATTN